MIDMLNVVITSIPQGRSGNDIIGSPDFLAEVDREIHGDFGIFYLLIVFRHLFFGVGQRVVSDGEELRVFPDTFHVSGRRLFTVAKSLLDIVGWVLRFCIIAKLHIYSITQYMDNYN